MYIHIHTHNGALRIHGTRLKDLCCERSYAICSLKHSKCASRSVVKNGKTCALQSVRMFAEAMLKELLFRIYIYIYIYICIDRYMYVCMYVLM